MNSIISILVALLLYVPFNTEPPMKAKLNTSLDAYLSGMEEDFQHLPEERKKSLKKLSLYISSKQKTNETAQLIFICTHNSRRSHMAQLWAQAAAHHYGVKGVRTFSGGTEATAFNPRAVRAMREAGFEISGVTEGDNPEYSVSYAPDAEVTTAFSKIYDHTSNPRNDFCAVMTCSHADKNCPFIPGASVRVAIPYEDPKEADGTEQEHQVYAERCRQIGTEMLYLFSQVTN